MTSPNSTPLVLPPAANIARAFQTTITLPNPAAATDAVYKVTGNFYEVILSVFFVLTTDATVGVRQGALAFADANGRSFSLLAAQTAQTASLVWDYTFGVNVAQSGSAASPVQTTTMPVFALSPGYSVTLGVLNFAGPADQVSSVALTVQRYPSDAGTEPPPAQPLIPTPIAL